jgi:potassium-dependent mechanosensitive channel
MPQHIHFALIKRIIQLVLILCLQSIFSLAQNPMPLNGSDTTKALKVIEAVTLSNFGIETETTLNKIRQIRNAIAPSSTEIQIDSLAPAKLRDLDKLKKSLDLEEISQMSIKENDNLKSNFTQWRVQLEGWRGEYILKSEQIYALRTELNDIKTKWEKTDDLKKAEKLPQELSVRIADNLRETNALIKELSNRSNDLLSKQDKITGGLIYIDEVLSAISKTEITYRQQVFTIDSPPIWHVFYGRADTLSLGYYFNANLELRKNELITFSENQRSALYLQILLFIIILFAMNWLRDEVKSWTDEKKDHTIKQSLFIISRPLASSMLVWLFLVSITNTEAPEQIRQIIEIHFIWPILFLLPGLIRSVDKRSIYFGCGIYLLAEIAYSFSDLVMFERLLFLFVNLSTIILLVILSKKISGLEEGNLRLNRGFVLTIFRIGIIAMGISFFANTFGNTVLARVLTEGSLTLIFGGVIIFAAALTIRSVFSLLMQNDTVGKLNMIQNYSEDVKRHIFKIIKWGAVFYWLYLTLSSFLVFDPLYNWLEELFTRERQVGSVTLSIGNLVAFVVTLWLALTLSRFIRFILQDEIFTHYAMPRGVPGAITMIVRIFLLFIGFILAFGAAKIDMSNITIIFGALGVGIGFGLQNIFNNLVSGLILVFERPIQVGDIIQVGNLNLMGEVKEIGIRASIVRTFDGAEVVVPNGNLISNELINWTLSDNRRRHEIIVGVAYGTDTKKVLEILNTVVPEHENVLKNPAPSNYFLEFGESSLNFRVLFWTHFDHGLSTKSLVSMAINEAFKEEGIEIPFPQRDLHLRSVSDKINLQNDIKTTIATKEKKDVAPKKSSGNTSE